jgi:hypothetical protein
MTSLICVRCRCVLKVHDEYSTVDIDRRHGRCT